MLIWKWFWNLNLISKSEVWIWNFSLKSESEIWSWSLNHIHIHIHITFRILRRFTAWTFGGVILPWLVKYNLDSDSYRKEHRNNTKRRNATTPQQQGTTPFNGTQSKGVGGRGGSLQIVALAVVVVLHFTSLHFTSLHFTSLPPSLHFHFTSLYFTSHHFSQMLVEVHELFGV